MNSKCLSKRLTVGVLASQGLRRNLCMKNEREIISHSIRHNSSPLLNRSYNTTSMMSTGYRYQVLNFPSKFQTKNLYKIHLTEISLPTISSHNGYKTLETHRNNECTLIDQSFNETTKHLCLALLCKSLTNNLCNIQLTEKSSPAFLARRKYKMLVTGKDNRVMLTDHFSNGEQESLRLSLSHGSPDTNEDIIPKINTLKDVSMLKKIRANTYGFYYETRKRAEKRTLTRSSIVTRFTWATIYDTWKFSKQHCPSASRGYDGPSARNLSTSTFKFYSSTDDSRCGKSSAPNKSEKDQVSCEDQPGRSKKSYEDSPSLKDPCDKKSTPDEYYAKEFIKQESLQDCSSKLKDDVTNTCTSRKDTSKDYSESSPTSRMSPVDDPCFQQCSPPPCPPPDPPCPCPEPEDICPDEDLSQLRFWRAMSLFVALPLVLIVSAFTYAKAVKEEKEPRLPYVDIPYMCIRTKPFPWGDGNHTLFHNPVKNPIRPHGYEADDPYEVKKKIEKD